MNRYQKGFIPIPIIAALVVSALVGGFLGYQLGDGTFFSLGFGLGFALILYGLVYKFAMPLLKPALDLLTKDKNAKS